MAKIFLEAEWRKLIMANYEIDPSILKPYLPNKTELDLFNGVCYVSLIGFLFSNTRMLGVKVPLHINFEEVNLRFYVRYNDAGVWKRGTVFIKEIVSKPAITFVANTLYKEKYETMPTRYSWKTSDEKLMIEYEWKKNKNWNSISIEAEKQLLDIDANSEAEFITEHYWGYAKMSAQKTKEYGVEHPRWQMYKTIDYKIKADFADLYGNEFSFLNQSKPLSVFLAEGSKIKIRTGKNI